METAGLKPRTIMSRADDNATLTIWYLIMDETTTPSSSDSLPFADPGLGMNMGSAQ